jgi:hypothetical protein
MNTGSDTYAGVYEVQKRVGTYSDWSDWYITATVLDDNGNATDPVYLVDFVTEDENGQPITVTIREVSDEDAMRQDSAVNDNDFLADVTEANEDGSITKDSGNGFAATVESGTTFLTNGEEALGVLTFKENKDGLTITQDNQSTNIALLVDDTVSLNNQVTTTELEKEMYQYAQSSNNNVLNVSEASLEYKYLDLVNTKDGNAVVMLADPNATVTIYWPYPDNMSSSQAAEYNFQILHFTDMNRENTLTVNDGVVDFGSMTVDVITPEQDGDNGLKFTTSSFSPFVLLWEKKSTNQSTTNSPASGGGGVTIPDPSPFIPSSPTVGVPDMLNGDNHFAYIIGFEDDTVKPMANITRAEVATIFFRLLKDDVREANLTTQNSFKDLNVGDWYNTAVSTMAALGIIKGRSADTFDPNADITRAELAAICARFDDTLIDTDPSTFNDIAGNWAETDILRAAALGWVEGIGNGSFGPNLLITRAESVTMINRVLNRVPNSPDDLLSNMRTWTDNLDKSAWYYLAVQEASNSHDFQMEEREQWTALTQDPDWTQYQN